MVISLGDINFGLGADTRRLEEARRLILSFGKTVEAAAQSQAEGARKVEAAVLKQEAAMVSSLQKVVALNASIRKLEGAETYINKTTNAFQDLVYELGRGPVKAIAYQRALEKFDAEMQSVNRSVSYFGQTTSKLESSVLKQQGALFRATQSVERYTAALRRLKAEDQSRLGQAAAASLEVYRNELIAAGTQSLKAQAATQKFQASLQKLGAEAQALKGKLREAELDRTTQAFRRLADVSILLTGPLSGIAARLTLISSVAEHVNASTAATVVGIAAATYAMYKLGDGAISATRELQRTTQALDSMYASSVLTENTMDKLRELADRAGADFLVVAKGFTRIEVASQGTNLEGEKAAKIFENLLFASIKLGSSQEELGGVLKAVEQIMSKGRVSREELAQQLGDRMPGAVKIMAQAVGVSTAELDKMMKAGELTSDVLEQFADVAVKRIGVDTTKAINNTVAAEARWSNALLFFNANADKAIGFTDAYVNTLEALTSVLSWAGNNIEQIIVVMGALAGAGAGLALAYYAPAIISGFGTLVASIRAVTVAVIAMNTAFFAGGLTSILALIARIGAAIGGAVLGFNLMKGAMSDQSKAAYDAVDGIQALIDKQAELRKTPANRYDEVLQAQSDLVKNLEDQLANLAPKLAEARKEFDSLMPPTDTNMPGLEFDIGSGNFAYDAARDKLAELEKAWETLSAVASRAKEKLGLAQEAVETERAAAAAAQGASSQEVWNEKLGELRTKMQDAVAIAAITKQYGKDSLELAKLTVEQEWRQIEAKALSQGATEAQLASLKTLYDIESKLTAEVEAQQKAKAKQDAFVTLRQELAVQQAILRYGEDSREVARLKLKFEDQALAVKLKALGATKEEVAQMIAVQHATENAANAAAMFGDRAAAAVGPFGQILGLVQSIASTLASIGMNTSGLKAQAEALTAGLAPDMATVEGKKAQKAEELGPYLRSDNFAVRVAAKASQLAYNKALEEEAHWQGIVNEKTKEYNAAHKSGGGGKGGGARVANTTDDALDSLRELDAQLAVAKLPAWQREAAKRQEEINAAVDAFKDKLTRANIPQEKAVELVGQYREKLTALKEADAGVQTQINLWDELSSTLASGMDNALDAYVDAVLNGEDALKSLLEVGKSVAADLLKTFMQLAWLNPLKNLLFGGDPTTGQAFPTLQGVGGLLGKLFGGEMAKGGNLKTNKWYIAGEEGPEPIWGGGSGAFASGYNGEGLPPSMSPASYGSKTPKVFVNIATQPGESVDKQSSESGDGMTQMESFVITTVNKAAADGRINKGMQAGFGLKPQNKTR